VGQIASHGNGNNELKNLRDPPIAINMVTSFNLSGTVFGLEVSFLVETGV